MVVLTLILRENAHETAGTETKSYIGKVLGIRVSDDFPFILGARDEKSGASKVVKILRDSDRVSSLAIRELVFRY